MALFAYIFWVLGTSWSSALWIQSAVTLWALHFNWPPLLHLFVVSCSLFSIFLGNSFQFQVVAVGLLLLCLLTHTEGLHHFDVKCVSLFLSSRFFQPLLNCWWSLLPSSLTCFIALAKGLFYLIAVLLKMSHCTNRHWWAMKKALSTGPVVSYRLALKWNGVRQRITTENSLNLGF